VTTSFELRAEQAAPQAPATARRSRRRRRPSGAPPPLPKTIGRSGKAWLVLLAVLFVGLFAAIWIDSVGRVVERADSAVLRRIARVRTAWLTDVAKGVDALASGWTLTIVAVATMVLLLVFKRWRHLFTYLGTIALVEVVASTLYTNAARTRPFGVTQIGRWAGYSMPSAPVAILTMVLLGVAYTLVVPGRPRRVAKVLVGVAIGAFVLARLYLGVDHPTDALVAVALAVAIPINAYRIYTPSDIFPVAYRRGKTAHLDVGGARGEALRRAVQDQLGLTVLDVKHVGLSGSGGSTPVRLRVEGDPDTYLFGKLFAMNHVRADRWYKLGRTILYGRLEDEAPFQSVRRLVEYEDYALRLLRDVGIRTATPYGVVEITPEREYLLVTEFFDGAVEIGDAPVDDGVIDQGLALVRTLWDAGVAHRDIKPANLMVRDGQLLLIDVFFVQVRPSPWRQAVDLANMMLVLAVRTDAERVYEHALRYFTPDDIAEAFAAAHGVASPTQLRAVLKQDKRDLVAQFRAMGPPRQKVTLQRWSLKRVGITAGLVILALFVVNQATDLVRPAHDVPVSNSPECGTSNLMVLMAQSVPSATAIPCVSTLPAGLDVGGVRVKRGESSFWLDSEAAGARAVEATLVGPDRCEVSGDTPVPSDEIGMQRFERPEQLRPALRTTRTYVFPGGCVVFRYAFEDGAEPGLVFAIDQALAFQPRAALAQRVLDDSGERLCGPGFRCARS
jgi:tRNA A-37 threonylcarbamoyl transferase component Bud32